MTTKIERALGEQPNKAVSKIEIRGASDDLVEVEGDLREEFGFYSSDEEGEMGFVAVSDGTLASIQYTGGFWRIHVLASGVGTLSEKRDGTDEEEDYSDVLTLTREGDAFLWVTFAKGKENCARRGK